MIKKILLVFLNVEFTLQAFSDHLTIPPASEPRAFPLQRVPGLMSLIYSTEDSAQMVRIYAISYNIISNILHFQIDVLDKVWELDEHTLIEATSLSDVLCFIKDQEGDFSG